MYSDIVAKSGALFLNVLIFKTGKKRFIHLSLYFSKIEYVILKNLVNRLNHNNKLQNVTNENNEP